MPWWGILLIVIVSTPVAIISLFWLVVLILGAIAIIKD
ncbi:hypothetical protein SIXOD_v1c26230 [Spiroplasma ixodetis Y32]|nr:hypothetical protein SIXOD_v1c01750 [Spiroplasma ixodetis Y32]WJG70671.1 hypothetical protein SIXOD_v1c18800 [Spiroplasma ixodetis Y32]WJG71246.1 hypothetical protein SIXOD_v1c26230 [Spiroplasma ixodetis Y32]